MLWPSENALGCNDLNTPQCTLCMHLLSCLFSYTLKPAVLVPHKTTHMTAIDCMAFPLTLCVFVWGIVCALSVLVWKCQSKVVWPKNFFIRWCSGNIWFSLMCFKDSRERNLEASLPLRSQQILSTVTQKRRLVLKKSVELRSFSTRNSSKIYMKLLELIWRTLCITKTTHTTLLWQQRNIASLIKEWFCR
jgi:hypothetical protein